MSMSKAKAENRPLPRRFYKEAAYQETEEGWRILLDGRPVKTPAKHTLLVPAEGLARAITEEWDAQKEHINPFTMPLTRLCHVALDRMGEAREAAAAEVAKFATTDLLSHRAEEADLAARQAQVFDPFLTWAESALDAPLKAAAVIAPLEQPETSIEALRLRALALDDLRLTALVSAAPILSSAILAFALLEAEADGETVWAASRLEEDHQIARWGEDAEAAEAAANKKRDLLACERLFRELDAAGV
ncbi:MAG: ATP12 family chaperone protein [Oceanicaulis sp.]